MLLPQLLKAPDAAKAQAHGSCGALFPPRPHCVRLHVGLSVPQIGQPFPTPLCHTGFKPRKSLCAYVWAGAFQWRAWQSTRLPPGTLHAPRSFLPPLEGGSCGRGHLCACPPPRYFRCVSTCHTHVTLLTVSSSRHCWCLSPHFCPWLCLDCVPSACSGPQGGQASLCASCCLDWHRFQGPCT